MVNNTLQNVLSNNAIVDFTNNESEIYKLFGDPAYLRKYCGNKNLIIMGELKIYEDEGFIIRLLKHPHVDEIFAYVSFVPSELWYVTLARINMKHFRKFYELHPLSGKKLHELILELYCHHSCLGAVDYLIEKSDPFVISKLNVYLYEEKKFRHNLRRTEKMARKIWQHREKQNVFEFNPTQLSLEEKVRQKIIKILGREISL